MNPNKLALACLAMSASVVFAQQSGSYSNKIIQIQQNDTGETVLYAVDNVSQSGEMDAPLPILYGNAAFELWSFNTVTGDSKLLNSTVVNGFYNPGFVVNTPDPNDTPLQPRTRVDVPYTVKITGISPGYESAAANTLGLIVNLDDFTGETFAFPSDHTPAYSSGTRIDSVLGSMIGNDLEVASNYVNQDWKTVGGRETYSLWEPNGNDIKFMTSTSVDIWPVASIGFAEGKGLVANQTYKAFDEVVVSFTNLYAKDTWRVWIEDEAGNEIPVQSGTEIGDKPMHRNVRVTDMATIVVEAGTYLLKASQQAEGLDAEPNLMLSVPFTYDRTIRVRGNVGTSHGSSSESE